MLKEISIVISTLNEEKLLPKLLGSIAEQNFTGQLEVIVIDGRSQDDTVAVANSFTQRIPQLQVFLENRGLPYQRNRGAEKTKYRNLLFLDADVILSKGCLNQLAQRIPQQEKFIAFIAHLPSEFNVFDYLFAANVFMFMAIRRMFGEKLIGGSFIFTTKTNHDQLGGFREGSVIGEDMDYVMRSTNNNSRYFFFYRPFVWISARRMHKEGRIKLLLKWYQCYRYIKKTKEPIFNENTWKYPYGDF